MGAPVVVIGGGVVGCAVARVLANDREVIVLERDGVASGATRRAAGLNTITADLGHVPAIASFVTEFFRAYDGTRQFEYAACPGLELVVSDPTDARERCERLTVDGIDVRYLDGAETAALHPALDGGGLAGSLAFADAGWFDPETYARTLLADAVEAGVTVRSGTTCSGFRVEDGRVTGVETDDGVVEAETVVAAAGWRTADLVADLVRIPVRPYRTQCVVLEVHGDWRDRPLGWSPHDDLYFRPTRDGNLLVGGGSAPVENPTTASETADEAFQERIADVLPRLFRGVEGASIVETWAGVDGATPDTYPIVDAPADGPDGLVLATGFHGRGVMTAAAAAKIVRSFVTGEPCVLPTDPFSLERFESRSQTFEFHSASA